ncbi:cytochrome o ubiquinol oxidase subunit IV [Jiella sonneratiae]|uniref:Cytochrome bo(3) ubiquinol oxidase subunit 4 n=1 Tax=Jiella sonneratiae TaxID=2816856 RepID=A0ABS3IXT0_9HYPH|nr:cytochrome o ubiquinol oxidase subunit IV [Jiella sonneratiae]MBO0902234.1 cytochrome o ubiquinol oxidase subunit IV [Jiella sonneratiae]
MKSMMEEEREERRDYLIGLAAAILLTAVPFAAVAFGWFPRGVDYAIIAVAGVLQIVCQFRYFLHIDLSRSKRDDLQLILFSGLICLLMVGGTIWIIFNQYAQM